MHLRNSSFMNELMLHNTSEIVTGYTGTPMQCPAAAG